MPGKVYFGWGELHVNPTVGQSSLLRTYFLGYAAHITPPLDFLCPCMVGAHVLGSFLSSFNKFWNPDLVLPWRRSDHLHWRKKKCFLCFELKECRTHGVRLSYPMFHKDSTFLGKWGVEIKMENVPLESKVYEGQCYVYSSLVFL